MSGTECKPCNDMNCSSCDTNNFKCNACHSGYFLDNGVCSACIEGCAACENKDRCKTCDGEFDYMMNETGICYYTEGGILGSGIVKFWGLGGLLAVLGIWNLAA